MIKSLQRNVIMTVAMLSISLSLVGCGNDEQSVYINAMNEQNDAISEVEEKTVDIVNEFAVNPGNKNSVSDYADVLTELADLYSGYGDIVGLEEYDEIHQDIIEAGNAIALHYKKMAFVLNDSKLDFTTQDAIIALLDAGQDVVDSSEQFIDAMKMLQYILNF